MNERIAHGMRFEATALIELLVLMAAIGVSAQLWHRSALAHAASSAQSKTEETGFYCNLKALTATERSRHKQLTGQLKQATLETEELPDGFAFHLEVAKISFSELAEWVSAERQCCPFFDFELGLQRDNGPLWLKLHGKDGVKTFMRKEFAIQ